MAKPPIVIDNGTGAMKAGFAGDVSVKCAFPSYIGRLKSSTGGATDKDIFIGKKAENARGILSWTHPIRQGAIRDWNDMELIWRHIFSELKAAPEEHPVLLTEAPLTPRRSREKAAEVFFETFRAPALFVSVQAILALYAAGRTTGVVLDSGDGATHAVPVYQGFALPEALMTSHVAGREVTDHLMLQLRRSGHVFRASTERETVRQIKEKECYVALHPSRLEQEHAESEGSSPEQHKHVLPDGSSVELGAERFRAPEVLFHPEKVGLEFPGIHKLLVGAISRADMDLRNELYSQIVLSGGSTMFANFGNRLLSEVKKLTPKDAKIRIAAPPDRETAAWIGGSMLASLETFQQLWVSKEKYKEEGVRALHKLAF